MNIKLGNPIGKHWTLYQKSGSGERLTEQQKIQFANPEVISNDDSSAICTNSGWSNYLERQADYLEKNGLCQTSIYDGSTNMAQQNWKSGQNLHKRLSKQFGTMDS